ncbi:hypothetical protein [Candidatus Liberibacter sp.]|uniref:hypothetical protein n=1 Tax=Candidatus Liberibacter sp. TaxID=34022 RepID=UPI0015F527D6|nr:hypothetical protein [Candidatus Liberibacter sp.]MBA5724309.1 hypothetical protein [Candidatus Liberibacter sp.]
MMTVNPHIAGWSSPVVARAHNLKVVGSNPILATNYYGIFLCRTSIYDKVEEAWDGFDSILQSWQHAEQKVESYTAGIEESKASKISIKRDGMGVSGMKILKDISDDIKVFW